MGLLNVAGESAFDERIRYWADQYGIPFVLAKALVAVESAFNAKAWRAEPHLGPTEGSRGLTQILHRTAKGLGFIGQPDELFEPDRNLRYGLAYLSQQLQRSNYSVADAVAAYNMGYNRSIAQTTPMIAKIYQYDAANPPAGWLYANEPYVRRVLMYAAFYLAEEQGNTIAMEQIRGIVKKKRLPLPVPTWSWVLGSSAGRRSVSSGTFDWASLSAAAAALGLPPGAGS